MATKRMNVGSMTKALEHNKANLKSRIRFLFLATAALSSALAARPGLFAQGGQAGAPPTAQAAPRRSPREIAPVDFTGYWVSIVTEDWRWRMITPDKGDYASIPLNPEGRRVADTWDPEKDQAEGNQCRAYAAPAIMRVPGRLHIYWQEDSTLRIETDAGTQTRTLHFVRPGDTLDESLLHVDDLPSQVITPSWQGYSLAEWEGLRPRPQGGQAQEESPGKGLPPEGYLKVITTHIRPGYLRKNGVPFSAKAVLEEDFDTFTESNGDKWLVVTAIVTDPQYLAQPFITSSHFKHIPDSSGWQPTPCEAK